MAHHPDCRDFRGRDPGFAPATGDEFIAEYNDRFEQFPIDTYKECLGCCLAYLIKGRNYTRGNAQLGWSYVHFPVGDPPNHERNPSVWSFARKPKGSRGKKGQIATEYEHYLGDKFGRTFQGSRTYQLYVPPGEVERGLSIGFPCTARMESVAIDVVDHRDLADIKLNFADAVLVERYREMYVPDTPDGRTLPSLMGYCMTPLVPDQADELDEGMQNVAIN